MLLFISDSSIYYVKRKLYSNVRFSQVSPYTLFEVVIRTFSTVIVIFYFPSRDVYFGEVGFTFGINGFIFFAFGCLCVLFFLFGFFLPSSVFVSVYFSYAVKLSFH